MDFTNIPIEDDFNECDKYSSVVERYYTPRYCMDIAEPGDDYCILIHSNRVCLVTLAPSHNLFKHSEIVSVNFQVSNGLDRLRNKVSGKWKHGAQKLDPKSPLMLITLSDGSCCTVRCGISGKLLEVNQSLLENPRLILTEPQGKGYIAIVLSEISIVQQYRNNLLNEQQYKEKCSELQRSSV